LQLVVILELAGLCDFRSVVVKHRPLPCGAARRDAVGRQSALPVSGSSGRICAWLVILVYCDFDSGSNSSLPETTLSVFDKCIVSSDGL
jgi:hypothetical protein